MRTILHVDMNAFFASCEQAHQPELKKKPLIVGGDPKKRRGIVLAASYDAKAYGVKTAMPIWQAMKLCPQAEVIQPTHNLYGRISREIMSIFDAYTPLKEQLSIDEAFLDMTGTEQLFGDAEQVSLTIQKRLLRELDIPCSIGISSCKLLAKMGSDYKKPLGITKIYPEDVPRLLWKLPVGELYGVGRKTAPALEEMGIKTIGDLANCPLHQLTDLLGPRHAADIRRAANGIDDRPVDPHHKSETKSVSNEITFSTDLSDLSLLKKEALLIADSVGWRVRRHMLKGRTISIKVKFNDFKVITRSVTINQPTDVTDIIYDKACELLDNIPLRPVRLLGVGVSNFGDTSYEQLSLFNTPSSEEHCKKEHVDQLVDTLRERFGYHAVKRASLVNNKYKPK